MKNLTGRAIIEEIRAARRQMSEECHHNPGELIALLKQYDAKYARQTRRYSGMRRHGRMLARAS